MGASVRVKKMCPGFTAQALAILLCGPIQQTQALASLRPKAGPRDLGPITREPSTWKTGARPQWARCSSPLLLSGRTNKFLLSSVDQKWSTRSSSRNKYLVWRPTPPPSKLSLFYVTHPFKQNLSCQIIWRKSFLYPHLQYILKIPVKPRARGVTSCLVLLRPVPW